MTFVKFYNFGERFERLSWTETGSMFHVSARTYVSRTNATCILYGWLERCGSSREKEEYHRMAEDNAMERR